MEVKDMLSYCVFPSWAWGLPISYLGTIQSSEFSMKEKLKVLNTAMKSFGMEKVDNEETRPVTSS